MRRTITAAVASAAFALLILIPTSASAASCSRSYVIATIGGVHKCLRRGEYCAHKYTATYKRYGFNCLLKSGAYHLEPR
jgi:hypothetical protein